MQRLETDKDRLYHLVNVSQYDNIYQMIDSLEECIITLSQYGMTLDDIPVLCRYHTNNLQHNKGESNMQTNTVQAKTIKVLYHNKDYPELKLTDRGDWVDLHVDTIDKWNRFTDKESIKRFNIEHFKKSEPFKYKKGDIIRFNLGVSMKLPTGYEALVAPRSSTRKHFNLIQTNSVGVIDHCYQGNDDEWKVECIAVDDGEIKRFDRVCQFRILKSQGNLIFDTVDELSSQNRGGYGISGK